MAPPFSPSPVFFLVAAKNLLLLSAAMVLLSRNPVHSVLFLVLAFCNGAVLLLLLGAEFLAMIFLVVYVGAIAVLFLFIVMMLNLKVDRFRQEFLGHYPLALLSLLFLSAELLVAFALPTPSPLFSPLGPLSYQQWPLILQASPNMALLGNLLYTYHYLPFLLSGFILLLAMVGSIVLSLVPSSFSLRQSIYGQVVRSNAVRLR